MRRKLLRAIAGFTGGLVLLLAALLMWPLPEIPMQGVAGDFLIRNVTVVDVEAGVLREKQNVVVIDGRIASVGTAKPAQAQASLVAIDGTGRYLMPGLWDMHIHSLKISSQYIHPLFIANGVTGVREMWGCMSEPDSFIACLDDLERWNEALRDKSGLSPRYVLQSSFQINGGEGVPDGMPDFFRARNAQEARELVAYYAEAGVDSLKTYSDLSAAAYHALADGAREHGIMLAGHRPVRVSLEEMLAAGQDSVEHPRLFLFECYEKAAAYRALPDPLGAYNTEMRADFIDRQDAERCASLIDAMAESDTWWTPTLQVLRMSALAADRGFRDDPRRKYIPYLLKAAMWMPDADRAAANSTDESGRNVDAAMYRMALQHVGQAHMVGVKILAGTDAGDTYVFPGFSIHDELVELVSAGLTPADALRSATVDAALFSGQENDFGSIDTGKVADMILLNADPLADIHNTRNIAGLFFNGQYFDRAALNQLLEFAGRQARSIRTNLHLLWDAVNSPIMRVQLAD
jgi:imidazolonepropionase-like amidohydrolase